ncbi:MAG TPA: biotin-dependent carboxyltransferase family protein, partial [Kofleriaceae bacterium]|nr:biotin-dependent carboxyltransferase family protein [Kofleriaceae bacterium]
LGRPGRMHEAVPPGGALVVDRLIAANRAARNPDGAPALEVLGQLAIRAERALQVATDTAPLRELPAGGELAIASEPRRVAYLAVRGGLDAPLVLGGRGALLCAGLGGLVRAGQRFATAGLAETAPPAAPAPDAPDAPIRLIAGPDPASFAPGALDVLLASEYRVLPTSNRVGTRLDGPALPRSDAPEVSRPMVLGAIEVPRDGVPIVLGPEHPTTGGYPIIAVVARADLGRLFSIRLGGTVRFTR